MGVRVCCGYEERIKTIHIMHCYALLSNNFVPHDVITLVAQCSEDDKHQIVYLQHVYIQENICSYTIQA